MFLGIYLFLPGCPIVGTYLFIVASYDLLYFCVSCNLSFISDFIWVAFLMKSKSWLLRWNFCHSVSVWPTVSLSSFPVLLSLYLADYFTVQYFYCISFCVYSVTIYFVVKLIYFKSNLHLINFNTETWEAHKMVEYKDPELTSSHEHTKITMISRTAIDEKEQNLPEKIFYT